MRHERTPHASIHHDELLILQPQIIRREHLAMSSQIITSVIPLHDTNIRSLGNELCMRALAVEDEYKIGFGV
jgi:hypothetical protein